VRVKGVQREKGIRGQSLRKEEEEDEQEEEEKKQKEEAKAEVTGWRRGAGREGRTLREAR
jgi:hypothetical protein